MPGVLIPLDDRRVKVKLLCDPKGTGEIIKEDHTDKTGYCWLIINHKDRRVEWRRAQDFEYIKK